MSAAAMEAPTTQTIKSNLELVQTKYAPRYGLVRTISEIAKEGSKVFFRVNYYHPQEQKFTSYWVSVSDGLVKDETK